MGQPIYKISLNTYIYGIYFDNSIHGLVENLETIVNSAWVFVHLKGENLEMYNSTQYLNVTQGWIDVECPAESKPPRRWCQK